MSNVHPSVPALFVAFGVFGISFGVARSLQPAGPASVGRAPLASVPSLPAPPASDDTPLTDLQPARIQEPVRTVSTPTRSTPPATRGNRREPPAEDLEAFQRQVDLAAERRGDSDREERRPEPKSPRCLVCGAPADSWVESEGVSRGYCRAHYGPASPPVSAAPPAGPTAAVAPPTSPPPTPPQTAPPGAAVSAPTAETPPAPSQEPARSATGSVQCRGTTRDGDRCRRKTRDPSGFCYQHQRTR